MRLSFNKSVVFGLQLAFLFVTPEFSTDYFFIFQTQNLLIFTPCEYNASVFCCLCSLYEKFQVCDTFNFMVIYD